MDAALDTLAMKAAEMGFNGDEDQGEDDEHDDTGVMTSQLRHFVIQASIRYPT